MCIPSSIYKLALPFLDCRPARTPTLPALLWPHPYSDNHPSHSTPMSAEELEPGVPGQIDPSSDPQLAGLEDLGSCRTQSPCYAMFRPCAHASVDLCVSIQCHKIEHFVMPSVAGHLAVWTVSSAKQGNGVVSLRDGDLTTTWQSDGHVPHVISAVFQKRVHVSAIRLFLDFGLDESYTPMRIQIKVGLSGPANDVPPLLHHAFSEPRGWQTIWIPSAAQRSGLALWRLEIELLQNHQNGRDSHVRQVQVLGPVPSASFGPGTAGGAMLPRRIDQIR